MYRLRHIKLDQIVLTIIHIPRITSVDSNVLLAYLKLGLFYALLFEFMIAGVYHLIERTGLSDIDISSSST